MADSRRGSCMIERARKLLDTQYTENKTIDQDLDIGKICILYAVFLVPAQGRILFEIVI